MAIVATKAYNISSISYKCCHGPSNGCLGTEVVLLGLGVDRSIDVEGSVVIVGSVVVKGFVSTGQLSTVHEHSFAAGSSTLMLLKTNAKASITCKTKSYTLQNLKKVVMDLAFLREFKSAHNMEMT